MPRTVPPTKTTSRTSAPTHSFESPAKPKRSLPPATPPDQESTKRRGRPTNKDLFTKRIKEARKVRNPEKKQEMDEIYRRANGVGIDEMFPRDMPNRLAEIQSYLGTPTPKVITTVPELWKNPPMLDGAFLKASHPEISPPLIQAICYGVERGMSLASICRYLGLDYKRIFEWRKEGMAKGSGLKYYLARGIEIARTRFEMTYLDIIQRAAFGLDPMISIKTKKVMGEIVEENMEFKTGKINPEHAKWLLERRLRTQYAPATVDPAQVNTMDNDYDDAEEVNETDALQAYDSAVLGPNYQPPIDVSPVEEADNGE